MHSSSSVDSFLNTLQESHAIGEIWTSMLFDMYWNLVDEFGFSENLFDATQSEGNIVAMQIVISGLTLQPCQPDFISARNAIIQADTNWYDGIHECLIWRAFAKRGLGIDARSEKYENDFKTPEKCKDY
jgi:extracellular elastinolytic metalloproteinase